MANLPAPPIETHTPAPWLEWLQRSAKRLPRTEQDAEELTAAIEAVTAPATKTEVATLALCAIAQHWVGEQPAVVQKFTANLWQTHLGIYPAWAIERAVIWWTGPENDAKRRSKRPQPGDIAERCNAEMAIVRMAETHLKWWSQYRGAYPSFIEDNEQKRAKIA